MNLLEGKLLAEGQRIGVVAARFNEFITAKLVECESCIQSAWMVF